MSAGGRGDGEGPGGRRGLPRLLVEAIVALAGAVWAVLRALAEGVRVIMDRAGPVLGPLSRRTARGTDRAARDMRNAAVTAGRRAVSTLESGHHEAVRAMTSLSAALSARRTLGAVVALAGVFLLVAQFADYRVVIAGTGELEASRRAAGSAHLYVLAPLALAALVAASRLGAGVAHRLGRLIAALGALTIAVTLAIDLPAARDREEFEMLYAFTRTELLGAFYVQLFSGIALGVAGATLWLGPTLRSDDHARRPERMEEGR